MEYKQWLEMLSAINADDDLNKDNVIEKIKEKLEKEDPGTYQEWQDSRFDINYTFNDQMLLHIVATKGLAKVTKLLIKKGADVNKANQYEWAPLHCAAENGHTEIVKALIGKEADVNAVEEDKWTPLHFAAVEGHTEIVNALIAKEAHVNAVNQNGSTPLHFAAQMGHTEIVNTLIENGANVNMLSESDKVTPLYLAVQSGHAEAVKALMEKGADPLLENKSYITLKRLTELIKNNSLEHLPKKAEEATTGREEEQVDDEYELLKYSLLFRKGCPLVDNVRRDTFDSLLCTWFADTSNLTPKFFTKE
ncbi:MAG: ankyrin repeat domain-containing protein [Wolbachia endosymbiont of Andrena nigroaenea]|uniref:ankyrin repeat domain-containing protein n=1 Tax=Wolbachia endosymbiont (group A) of Andrena hattorfiana TaxID=2953977 RepID=UPI0021F86BED|nr:ankyrin repeat domain-containing protein [Wolbachia endosymbiont (group A) of Andrena hattorfiana]MDX5526503.1 ankyrin repeat domain-containing protein [Wolbachia endosymbiont of Andrena nigroaenea]